MATEADKFKLGLFIIAAVLVFLAGLIALGSGRLFSHPLHIVTFFDESVQGLEPGSAVKWRGVRVGRVSRIILHSDARLVRVDMEIDRRRFINAAKTGRRPLPDVLREKIKEGLRSQLELTGITGMKDVEFDYFPEKQRKNQTPAIEIPNEICIPSVPSQLAELQEFVTDTAQRISSIDFERISAKFTQVLDSANQVFADPALKESIRNIQQASRSFAALGARIDKYADPTLIRRLRANLQTASDNLTRLTEEMNRIVEAPAVRRGFSNFQAASDHFRNLMARLDSETCQARLPELVQSARKSVDEARRAALAVRQTGVQVSLTLQQLDQTLTALRRLIQEIQVDPSTMVRGRRVRPPKRK